jgi:hypothetical protein
MATSSQLMLGNDFLGLAFDNTLDGFRKLNEPSLHTLSPLVARMHYRKRRAVPASSI